MSHERIPTAVDTIADAYLDATAAHNPIEATYFGITDYDDKLPDLTPDWYASRSEIRRRALTALAAATPQDSADRITASALRDELSIAEELRAAGEEESSLKNIASPLQEIRDAFDITPSNNLDDLDTIARRMRAVPGAIAGYIESLRFAAARGDVVARRQVEAGIHQCEEISGASGFFASYASSLTPEDGGEVSSSLRSELEDAAAAASTAYSALHDFLRDELLAQARSEDACGRDVYAVYSQAFLGARVDLEETYEWGQAELARITAEMHATASRIKPGASIAEAIAVLDNDESRALHGTEALQRWMQTTSDAAVDALAGTHFDIPEAIRVLECRIAPTHQGGIYYTAPSEDLVTRPGQMWWSVPEGVTKFGTWRELTTVYHEGVPGHHLQVAQTLYRTQLLNRWRRIASWVSGHGEGWALYAERLMADLGFLDDPGDYMGMLDGQSLRSARVVIDIGVHCGFDAPAELGGGAWTYDKAWQFLSAHVHTAEGFRRFELDRYLGWPGQAPSYKIGERLWLQLREDAKAKQGDAFDLKTFHRHALDVGSVGLDILRSAVLGDFG